MCLFVHNRWLHRAIVVAVAAPGFCALALPTKPAEAAFVSVGVGVPGYYYAPAPACTYYYPYGCYGYAAPYYGYGYAAPYYAPTGVVAGGWGWGRPCWGCGRFGFGFGGFRRFDRDDFRRFGFAGPGFVHGGFGGPGFMRGGFGRTGFAHGGFGGGRR